MGYKEPKNKSPILSAISVTTVIGAELAIMVTVGFYAGKFLDAGLGTSPWLMVAGILLGVATGTWGIIKTLNRFWKDVQ
ncbi:MAG: AtpZ/AtpI family protein [Clostridiales bacterium]|nr:AtpZ/AtpI family protein [Clostridiales bacterium]MCF8022549.1 AtpZ/AtpI family protein [Clostridiales bacterium]